MKAIKGRVQGDHHLPVVPRAGKDASIVGSGKADIPDVFSLQARDAQVKYRGAQ